MCISSDKAFTFYSFSKSFGNHLSCVCSFNVAGKKIFFGRNFSLIISNYISLFVILMAANLSFRLDLTKSLIFELEN